ncbi:MAG: hypothetical protein ACEY3K_09290, partial [Wolbachia sp.]
TNNYQHRRPSHFNLTMMSMCQYVNVSVCQYVTKKKLIHVIIHNSVNNYKHSNKKKELLRERSYPLTLYGYTYPQDKVFPDDFFQETT